MSNNSIQFNPTEYNINELLDNSTVISNRSYYSTQAYLDAIAYIQSMEFVRPENIQGLGRKFKSELAKLLPFILKLLNRSYNNFKLFPISTSNSKWIVYPEDEFEKYCKAFNIRANEVYEFGLYYEAGRHQQQAELFKYDMQTWGDTRKRIKCKIELLEKLGALKKVCNSYKDIESGYLYSSKYIVSKDKLRELVSLIIESYTTLTNTSITYSSYLSSNTTYLSSNTIHSSIRGHIRANSSNSVSFRHSLIEYNNQLLPPEEQLRWNEDKRRIYADVNGYTNLEKQIAKNPNYKRNPAENYKEDYCDSVFGKDNWFEFDRRGSIYNLTYSLNKHEYLDNDIDIYEKMNNVKFSSAEERQLYKLTQMSVYFSTYGRQIHYILRHLEEISLGNDIKPAAKELIDAYWKLYGNKEGNWNKFVDTFKREYKLRQKSMRKFIGDNRTYIDKNSKYSANYNRNETDHIFIKESEVYLQFVTKLREQGIRVIQVYDGFYFENGSISETELNNILRETIIEYCNKK